MPDEPWVIVPCSGAKADGAHLPARARYTGSFHAAAMAAALRITRPDYVLVASARYGLLDLDADTEPYDLRLDRLAAEGLRQWHHRVQADVGGLWSVGRYAVRTADGWVGRPGRPGAPVVLFTPRFYTEQLLAIPLIRRHAVLPLPFEGCAGIGEMRHVLSTFAWPPAARED